jgi:hypothetical protein
MPTGYFIMKVHAFKIEPNAYLSHFSAIPVLRLVRKSICLEGGEYRNSSSNPGVPLEDR